MPAAAADWGPKTGRLLRMPDVVADVKLSAPTINRLHRRDEFPPKVRISPNAVAWWEGQIEHWKRARPRAIEK